MLLTVQAFLPGTEVSEQRMPDYFVIIIYFCQSYKGIVKIPVKRTENAIRQPENCRMAQNIYLNFIKTGR